MCFKCIEYNKLSIKLSGSVLHNLRILEDTKMKKILSSLLIVFYCVSLFSQLNVLVDLIHGVNYYTNGYGEYNIQFYHIFQGYNIIYLHETDIILDEVIINETQMGNQQLIYTIDLPSQEELESVKALYIFADFVYSNASDVTGILINPQEDIVSEMFNSLIHYDDAFGTGWQIELNLPTDVEYEIVIGYGDVLFESEMAPGQFNLSDYDCAIRIVDETFSALNGIPEEYSEFDLAAFSEAFEDSLGFLNVYNLQDIYWLKPFVHFDVNSNIEINFEVFFPGNKTLAKPDPVIKKGNLKWNNFPIEAEKENEIIYEAAFDSRLNFIHFKIKENTINLQNQVPHDLDNIFIFKYADNDKYLFSELKTLDAESSRDIYLQKEYTTSGLRNYIKQEFYETAIENGLKKNEAQHLVYDFIWIESLLKRARNYPADYFGFYHFNGELYDKLVPYNCYPKPEIVERNAWVMLSNIKNRREEPAINFPKKIRNNPSGFIIEDFTFREYGVADEHYTRTLISREELFNVELGEYFEYEVYGGHPQFYDNQVADLLSQFIGSYLYVDNGEYSFIVDNPIENGILNLGELLQPTVVLSSVGENGKVISFGSAGFYANSLNCRQFINNCANFLTGNEIVQVGVENTSVNATDYFLYKNVPNPFHANTVISFSIPEENKINISVFNIKGQKVKTLTNAHYETGLHSVSWKGEDDSGKSVSSGLYLYKLYLAGKPVSVKKCLLLK